MKKWCSFEVLLRAIEWVAAVALLSLMVLVFVSVAMRFLFNSPIKDAFDLSRMFLGVAVFWGIAAACGRDEYIRGDLFFEGLSDRAKLLIDGIGRIGTLAFVLALAWKVTDKVLDVRRGGEVSSELQIAIWPFYLLMCLGAAMTLVTVVVRLIRIVQSGSLSGDPVDPSFKTSREAP
jgi:TRAP-type C4-dicarboxylate transport system permease small subunit